MLRCAQAHFGILFGSQGARSFHSEVFPWSLRRDYRQNPKRRLVTKQLLIPSRWLPNRTICPSLVKNCTCIDSFSFLHDFYWTKIIAEKSKPVTKLLSSTFILFCRPAIDRFYSPAHEEVCRHSIQPPCLCAVSIFLLFPDFHISPCNRLPLCQTLDRWSTWYHL